MDGMSGPQMDVPAGHGEENGTTFTVLITGANSGLGFALCCRLMDEFLATRPPSQTLHLLFSTRDAAKSEATSLRLHAHLRKTLLDGGRTAGRSRLGPGRVTVEGVQVDLLRLASVKGLAEELRRRGEPIDGVVWNAGIAGWKGVGWGKGVWGMVTDLVQATTWPAFMVCDVGLRAPPQQLPAHPPAAEPSLGQVFLANVFAHYLLTHWLAPLFRPHTRIVWTGSISAAAHVFSPDDVQGLRSHTAYESSKRLTDVLVLTSESPATRPYVQSLLPAPRAGQRPKMFVVHPGVVGTSIAGLHWFMAMFVNVAFYMARLLGSPWHPVQPYKGAASAAFTLLSPQIPEREESEGKGKWGSSTGVCGDERVARTEVDGWGYCGRVGVVPEGSVTSVRYRHRTDLTEERREEFEHVGRQVWKQMEELRMEWERRLGSISQAGSAHV